MEVSFGFGQNKDKISGIIWIWQANEMKILSRRTKKGGGVSAHRCTYYAK
jgi:hypothetical protein